MTSQKMSGSCPEDHGCKKSGPISPLSLRKTFGRFLERDVVEQLIDYHDIAQFVHGTKCTVTCMFCDVCGFTALSEKLAPMKLFQLLNTYFANIINVVTQHNGTIDKFIGDSVMVVFGAPVPQPDHAVRAVRCAIDIQKKISSVNDCAGDNLQLHFGIGINTGEVVAGCLGNDSRMDYTVLGDVINTAARLEGRTGPGQILLGPGTSSLVKGACKCRRIDPLKLKGKSGFIETYEVFYS
jgi:adenylate cyclase